MMVLDEQARDILRRLRPGDLFTLRGEPRSVLLCSAVEHPVESEPWVRAYVQEGPRGHRRSAQYRSPAVSRIERILPKE